MRYQALDDPNCAVVKKRPRQHQLVRSLGGGKKHAPSSRKPSFTLRATSTESAGLSFQVQRPVHTDASHEIDALKCIILRENYLCRLRELSRTKDLSPKIDAFADLIDLLRSVTLDVVDHISLWRRNAAQTSQFMWNGVNYLLKIPSDLDFFAGHKQIAKWYGASAARNPFLVERCLDDSPASTNKGRVAEALAEKNRQEAKAKRKEKVQRTPYDTPIVNDPALNPAPPKPVKPVPKKIQSMAPAVLRKGKMASRVCAVDMVRVLAAEKSLLQEEERFGVFTRDGLGRIVPLILGADEANSQGTHSKPAKTPQVAPAPSKVPSKALVQGKRTGGDLTVLTRKETRGRRHLPSKRSRGALIDVNIKRKQLEVGRLSERLDHKRKELEKLQEELTLLVSEQIQTQSNDNETTGSIQVGQSQQRQKEVETNVFELQQEVEVEQHHLQEQQSLLQRKQVARDSFKQRQHEAQVSARNATIARKQAVGAAFSKTVDLTPSGTAEEQRRINEIEGVVDAPGSAQDLLVFTDHSSAIQIQRIVRGKLGRLEFIRVFKERTAGALTIQSWTRMNMGKVAAAHFALQVSAVKLLQRVYRGEIARRYTRRLAHDKASQLATLRIQTQLRAHWGRLRMVAKRTLVRAKRECASLADQILQEDLDELASIKQADLQPNAHSLVISVLILLARGNADVPHHVERLLPWKACKRGLRRHVCLRKVKALAQAAAAEALFVPTSRIGAMERHLEDPALNVRALSQLPIGSRGAQLLLQWIKALLRVVTVLPQFIEGHPASSSGWKAVLEADDESGAELWEALEDDYDSDGIDPECYVEEEVLRSRVERSKPLLLVVSSDIAFAVKTKLIREVKQRLPGVFNHMRMPCLEVEKIQTILESGQSALIECDIGLCKRDRSAFLRMANISKASLLPSPDLILVHADVRNRGPRRSSDAASKPFLGVREDFEDSKRNLLSPTTLKLKTLLEDAATAVFELARPDNQTQLDTLRSSDAQSHGVILIVEAVMILLSPDKEFASPLEVPAVSWSSARTILDTVRCAELSSALLAVDIHNVPSTNLEALRGYRSHEKWQDACASTAVCSSCLRILQWWVDSVVEYATEVEALGGPVNAVSNQKIFSATVRVTDGIQTFPAQFDRTYPVYKNGERMLPEHGITRALKHLFEAIMRPLRVYSESRPVPIDTATDGRKLRLIISVYHEPQAEQIGFCGYDPLTSQRFLSVIHQTAVNRLLAPNSVELQDPRRAPRTPQALYMRLVELLTLRHPRTIDGPLLPMEMEIRRKRHRLLRTVRSVDAKTVVVTATEAAPGDVTFEAYSPLTSTKQEVAVSSETIASIRAATMSQQEKQELRTRNGRRMALFLLDRLKLGGGKLALFTGSVVGRQAFAGSVSISGVKHIVNVHISSATQFMYISAYEPRRSALSSFSLSPRARLLLLGSLNQGHRDEVLEELFERLHLHKRKHETETFSTMFRSKEDQEVVLDRSVMKQAKSVPTVGKEGEKRTMMLHCCASPDILRQTDDEEGEGSLPLVEVIAYDKPSKLTLRLVLSQREMAKIEPGWQYGHEALYTLADLLRVSPEDERIYVYIDGQPLGSCDVKEPEHKPIDTAQLETETETETEDPSKRVLPSFVPSNIDDAATLEFVRTVQSVERRRNPEGKIIYKHGHVLAGHYVIVTAWKQDGCGLILECYEPQSLVRVIIDLSSEDSLRRAVGPAQDLVDAGDDLEIISHIIRARISVSGSPPVFGVRTSRLFTSDKVTPIHKLGEAFESATQDAVILPRTGRMKVLTLGVKIRVERSAAAAKGDSLPIIITAFETERSEVTTKYYKLTAPSFHLVGYDPGHQEKLHLDVDAADTYGALAPNDDLLLPHNRVQAVKSLMPLLRVQREPTGRHRLTLPWKRLKEMEISAASPFDKKDLVIATGIKVHGGLFVVVRLHMVCKASTGKVELHVEAYDPAQGMCGRFCATEETRELVVSLREDYKKLVQMLRRTLRAEVRVADGIPILFAKFNLSAYRQKEIEEGVEESPRRAQAKGTRKEEALLLPANTMSGECLLKSAKKVGDFYCIASIHTLLDTHREEPVGLVLQVYCPSIAQLACASLKSGELLDLLQSHNIQAPSLQTAAEAVSSLFDLHYSGVHGHLKIIFKGLE